MQHLTDDRTGQNIIHLLVQLQANNLCYDLIYVIRRILSAVSGYTTTVVSSNSSVTASSGSLLLNWWVHIYIYTERERERERERDPCSCWFMSCSCYLRVFYRVCGCIHKDVHKLCHHPGVFFCVGGCIHQVFYEFMSSLWSAVTICDTQIELHKLLINSHCSIPIIPIVTELVDVATVVLTLFLS